VVRTSSNAKRARRPSWLVGASAVLLAAGWACSSSSAPKPAELGDCHPVGDAGCSPISSSGAGGGPTEGGSADGAPSDAPATECGTIPGGFQAACTTCIQGLAPDGCCGANLACQSQPDCASLVSCAQGCGNDSSCAGSCEQTFPGGTAAYTDFAQCLTNHCSPECPTLLTGPFTDF
jgi:hypothetical protein